MPDYFAPIDISAPDFGDLYDELPLWSAPFGRMLLERVPMKPGQTVLDVGAGTGFLTLELAQRGGRGTTVIAVDPWATAMKRLRRKVAHLGLTNVRLLEQDGGTIDLPDASVDVVVSNLGINNFENAGQVLATCFRLLKAGGVIVLTSNLVGHMQEFYDIYREVLTELWLTEHLAALDAHIHHRATIESMTGQLTAAGFTPGDVTRDSMRMRFADGSSLFRHAFIRMGFLPAWRAIVPTEQEERTFSVLERRLNAEAATRGELALTIPMACVEARRPPIGGST